MSELRTLIEKAINSCSAEQGSSTPDFILAQFLVDCLAAFDAATRARTQFYNTPKIPHAEDADDDHKRRPVDRIFDPKSTRRDAKGNIIPWAKEHDYFMGFDPDNPDVPTD